jgi:hypothetical protein
VQEWSKTKVVTCPGDVIAGGLHQVELVDWDPALLPNISSRDLPGVEYTHNILCMFNLDLHLHKYIHCIYMVNT